MFQPHFVKGSFRALVFAVGSALVFGCDGSATDTSSETASQGFRSAEAPSASRSPELSSSRENSPAALAAPALALAAAPAPDPTQKGQKYAVLIGVNGYTVAPPLKRSVKDAHDLGKLLESIGFKVLLVTDKAERKPATHQDLRSALLTFTPLTRPGDTILFYFSGHGMGYRKGGQLHDYVYPMIGTSRQPETLLPLREVCQILSNCKASHRIVMVDACRNTPLSMTNGLREFAGTKDERFAALYSTSPGNVSLETGFYKDTDGVNINNGVFTHFVLKGLSGKAEKDGDGVLSFFELADYVARQMLDLSFAIQEMYQIPYWNRGLATNRIFLRTVPAPDGSGPAPGSLESIVQIALRQPPVTIERYLMDELFGVETFRNDPDARKEAFEAIGKALGEQLRTKISNQDQLNRFIALLQTVLKMDGAAEVSLSYLNVGVEARDLQQRVNHLAMIPRLKGARNHPEVAHFFRRALPPLLRTAIDYQNLPAIKSLFSRGVFPETASCSGEAQNGVIRMEVLDRPRWADEVYRTLRPHFQDLTPPASQIWAAFEKGVSTQDFSAIYTAVEGLLEVSDEKQAARERVLSSLTEWLRGQLASTQTPGWNASQFAARMGALLGLQDLIPELPETLRTTLVEHFEQRVVDTKSLAELKDALDWKTVAVAGGVPAKTADDILRAHLERFEDMLVNELPPAGDPLTSGMMDGEILTWLSAEDPSFTKKLGEIFLGRARGILSASKESIGAQTRYLPEYALAVQLGVDPKTVLEDIFPAASRKTPPTDPGELRARTRVFGSLHARVGEIDGMEDIAGSLARGGMDLRATDVIESLLKIKPYVSTVRAVVTARLSAALKSLTPDPGVTERLAGILDTVRALDPAFKAAGRPLVSDVQGLKQGFLTLFRQPVLEDVGRAEALLTAGTGYAVLHKKESAACWAKLVTDSQEGDPALTARLEKFLSLRGEKDFAEGPAPRVFQYYYGKEDWDAAAAWIEASGSRIDAEQAARIGQIKAFHDRVRGWVGRRIPVVKKAAGARRATETVSRFEIVIQSLQGYQVSGTTVGARRRGESQFAGRLGDGWLELGPAKPSDPNQLYVPQPFLPQPCRFQEEGSYAGAPLFKGAYTHQKQGSARVIFLEPRSDRVLLDSWPAISAKHRNAPGRKWLGYGGGGKELLFPVFLRDRVAISWLVADLFKDKGRRLEGTLVIPDGARLDRWKKQQTRANTRCKVQVFVGSSGAPLKEIEVNISGAPTPLSVDIPAGAETIRFACLGKFPRPFLACTELCVVEGGGD